MKGLLPALLLVVCIAPHMSRAQGQLRRPSISISNYQPKQGDTLEIECSTALLAAEDRLKIIKVGAKVFDPFTNKDSMEIGTNYVMSTNLDLDPDLVKNERYSISGGPVSDGYMAKITITDTIPMDSGIILCSTMSGPDNAIQSVNTSKAEIYVKGPIRKVEINSPPIRPKVTHSYGKDFKESDKPVEADQSPLIFEAGKEVEIECQVTLDSKPDQPIVQVFLGNEKVTNLQRSKYTDALLIRHPGKLYDGFAYLYYYWNMTPSLKHHGKNVTCQAQLPNTWTETVTTYRPLTITGGPPEDGKCEPSFVEATVGTTDVKLTCTALAKEEPELSISWFGPGDIGQIDTTDNKAYTASIQRDGLLVTSSLTVAKVTELGKFRVVWSNDNGQIEAEVEIGNQPEPQSGSLQSILNIFLLIPTVAMVMLF